jgi:hypothetical protein
MKNEQIYPQHALTLLPGGYTLELTRKNGSKYLYQRVKFPKKYIAKVLSKHEIDSKKIVSAKILETNEVIYANSI